jgi:hypothetical protein
VREPEGYRTSLIKKVTKDFEKAAIPFFFDFFDFAVKKKLRVNSPSGGLPLLRAPGIAAESTQARRRRAEDLERKALPRRFAPGGAQIPGAGAGMPFDSFSCKL